MKDLSSLMTADIYLNGLPEEERKRLVKQLAPAKTTMRPLLCWDIASQGFANKSNLFDIEEFENMKAQYNWKFDLEHIKGQTFDALVVTNEQQRIIWVSNGFKAMTGYTPSFAKNKKPSFLQGKNTDPKIKQEIREAISSQKPVTATIVNYRKDGTAYDCHVQIIPLFTEQGKLTHFLALESDVSKTT